MNVVKMITVPKWEWSKDQGWIIDKSSFLNFLELPVIIESPTFWTEAELRNLFPKNQLEETISKVSVMWEILEHQKKQIKAAA